MAWGPKDSVVVPVDFSEESVNAIRTAIDLADDASHVHLVHVLVPLDAVSHGFEGVSTTVRTGNPGLEVVEYADELKADLIVISSHGYHGVKRMLLGSVAERILRYTNCPVLVLRRTDAD